MRLPPMSITARSLFVVSSFVVVSGASMVGCDGCGEPLSAVPVGGLPVGDVGEGRVLTYVGEEPLTLFHGQNTMLRFTRKNQDGTPVKGDLIKVEVHGSVVTAPGDTFETDT